MLCLRYIVQLCAAEEEKRNGEPQVNSDCSFLPGPSLVLIIYSLILLGFLIGHHMGWETTVLSLPSLSYRVFSYSAPLSCFFHQDACGKLTRMPATHVSVLIVQRDSDASAQATLLTVHFCLYSPWEAKGMPFHTPFVSEKGLHESMWSFIKGASAPPAAATGPLSLSVSVQPRPRSSRSNHGALLPECVSAATS